MSKLFIDPCALAVAGGAVLPDDDPAKKFAVNLPAWHPARRFLSGPYQGLAINRRVYGFLRLFSMVYEQYLHRTGADGRPQSPGPLPGAVVLYEHEQFLSTFPADVIIRGTGRCNLHHWYRQARKAVDDMTRSFPPIRTNAIQAFDQTIAQLARRVRLAAPLPRPFNTNSFPLTLVRAP
jgi:hypothetical protein